MRLPVRRPRVVAGPSYSANAVLFAGPWRHRDIYTQGIRLHVADERPATPGPHPLVICVHGFSGCWSDFADLLGPLAAAGWHAVAVDLRGFGASDKPPRGYDLPTAVGDITGLIQALGYSRAVLIGHGEGAAVGLAAAALSPQRVAAVVSMSCPHPLTLRAALWRDPAQWGALVGPLVRRQLAALGAPVVGRRQGRRLAAGSAPGFLSTGRGRQVVHRAELTIQYPRHASSAAKYRRWLVWGQFTRRGRALRGALTRRLSQPVVMLRGGQDRWVTPRAVADIQRYASQATVYNIAAAGHFLPLEAPGEVMAVLAEHMAQWRSDVVPQLGPPD